MEEREERRDAAGTPEIFCTQCGKKQSAGMRFCIYCGAPMHSMEPDAASGPPPEAPPETPPNVPPETPPYASPGEPPKLKKGRGKKIALAVFAALMALAAIAGTLTLAYLFRQHRQFQSYLDTGLRYLEDGNYKEAVLAFDAAIEINPRSAKAYLGRGDANTGLERFDDAVDDYLMAKDLTPKNPDVYLNLANAYLELGDEDEALCVLEEGAEATQDGKLSDWAQELRRMREGDSTLTGAVSEYSPGGGTALLPGAKIRLYVDMDGDTRLARTAVSGGDGGFSMQNLPAGTYQLRVDAEDHIGIQTTETLKQGEENYTELFLMIPETGEVLDGAQGGLDAYVTNALNGDRLAGVEIALRPGWNNQTGPTVATAVTDADGRFTLDGLEYGYYTAETSTSGDFVTAYHNVAVVPEEFPTQWNLPMTPLLAPGETRIVLTWNEIPWDLDSHLVSDSFHVAFWDRDGYDRSGNHRANLDLDDTTSYGPETVTIYDGVDGTYTYFVHDYTNSGGSWSGGGSLATSGATVRVYQRSGLVAEYHVPTQGSGLVWTVFRLHSDGTIETVNAMSDSY